jgi:hypothetical protein
MKQIMSVSICVLALVLGARVSFGFEMTPGIQGELEKQKAVVAKWAAEPALIKAVTDQNVKGPIQGMDNSKWKTIRRSDGVIKDFQTGPAGQFLKSKLEASGGLFSEAFLNGSQGEKVAFVDKTSSYTHLGQPKFDVPFTSGKTWQGKAEFDESSQAHAIQISVPVLKDAKPIGVLVVGVNLTTLEKVSGR